MTREYQSVYSAILRRSERNVPTYNEVRRDVRHQLDLQTRALV